VSPGPTIANPAAAEQVLSRRHHDLRWTQQLVAAQIPLRSTRTTVWGGLRDAFHSQGFVQPGGRTVDPRHRPLSHRIWAKKVFSMSADQLDSLQHAALSSSRDACMKARSRASATGSHPAGALPFPPPPLCAELRARRFFVFSRSANSRRYFSFHTIATSGGLSLAGDIRGSLSAVSPAGCAPMFPLNPGIILHLIHHHRGVAAESWRSLTLINFPRP